MLPAFLGLGSNLQNPKWQVTKAMDTIADLEQITMQSRSHLYQSTPLGPQDQPDFINAVCKITTSLTPKQLLQQMQHIEALHDRRRERHWGPRTLDIDILLFAEYKCCDCELTLPHPGIYERDFVLVPLYEIAPELAIFQQINFELVQGHNLQKLSACR